MGMNKARIGFILGIIVALLIGTADIPGLARNGAPACHARGFLLPHSCAGYSLAPAENAAGRPAPAH